MPTPQPGAQIPVPEDKDKPAVVLATTPGGNQEFGHPFGVAIQLVADGKKVTRKEWGDERIYLHLRANIVHIMFPDGGENPGDHILQLRSVDIKGNDWVVVE